VKKITQECSPKNFFSKILIQFLGTRKSSQILYCKKLLKEHNCSRGENSPNQVTLGERETWRLGIIGQKLAVRNFTISKVQRVWPEVSSLELPSSR
jgi:hypothetical protein